MSFLGNVGNEEERNFWGGRKNMFNLSFLLLKLIEEGGQTGGLT